MPSQLFYLNLYMSHHTQPRSRSQLQAREIADALDKRYIDDVDDSEPRRTYIGGRRRLILYAHRTTGLLDDNTNDDFDHLPRPNTSLLLAAMLQ